MNNKYCASGKIFEFLYEGIPVVTTTNITLKTVCDEYNICLLYTSFSIMLAVFNYHYHIVWNSDKD